MTTERREALQVQIEDHLKQAYELCLQLCQEGGWLAPVGTATSAAAFLQQVATTAVLAHHLTTAPIPQYTHPVAHSSQSGD